MGFMNSCQGVLIENKWFWVFFCCCYWWLFGLYIAQVFWVVSRVLLCCRSGGRSS